MGDIRWKRRDVVYCIAILTDQKQEGQKCSEYIRNYCTEKKVFPLIEIYQDQEQFFEWTRKTVPAVVLLALPGVSGLNAAEHLRSLYPKCGIIWCSDLDFSLHAFRMRCFFWLVWYAPAAASVMSRNRNTLSSSLSDLRLQRRVSLTVWS